MFKQAALVFVATSMAASAAMGAAPVYEPTSERLERVENQLNYQGSENLSDQVRGLQEDLQNLRGRIELAEHELSKLNDKQRDYYSDLSSRLSDLEQGTSGKLPLGAPPEKHAAPVGPTSAIDDYKQYQSAYELLQKKHYDQAVQAFNEYVQGHPNGQFAPNAYYWIGETEIIHDDLNAAKLAFQKIIHDYPGHQKSADALLKLGYVYDAAGEQELALKTLTEVTKKYPGSSVARMATKRIAQINQKG